MWTDHALNEKIYDLTRQALHADSEDGLNRALWDLEDIVQSTGYPLPVQKVFLLWESGRISADRLIIFLEDCYKWASELSEDKASDLRNEVVRWTFQMLWRVTRPMDIKKRLDDLSEFLNLSYSLTYEGLEYVRAFEEARRALDCLYKIFSEAPDCDLGSD
jgi:hypothetical protein